MAVPRNLILTVCTGNICRSPMAEKLLQHALAAEPTPLNELEVVSAGVAAYHGEPASANSVAALRRVHLDLSRHKSQPVSQDLIDRAFLILGMTRTHLEALENLYDNLPERCFLYRHFMGPEHSPEIPDPYGQNLRAYTECMDALAEAVPSIVSYLKNEYK